MRKIRKIVIIVFIAAAAVASILIIPSAEFDYKVLGDKYKQHLYKKYQDDFSSLINNYNSVYKDSSAFFDDYYSNDADSDGLIFSVYGYDNVETVDKIVKFEGRKVYITYTVIEYNGKSVDIIFEGTKRVFDVYSWEMVKNELFPINDDSVSPAFDLSFAEKQ